MDIKQKFREYHSYLVKCLQKVEINQEELAEINKKLPEDIVKYIINMHSMIFRQPSFIENSILKEQFDDVYYTAKSKELNIKDIENLFDLCPFGGNALYFISISENDLVMAMFICNYCQSFIKHFLNKKCPDENTLLCFLPSVRNKFGKRLAFKIKKGDDNNFYIDGVIEIDKETEGMYLLDFMLKYYSK